MTLDGEFGPVQMESSPPITEALQPLATESASWAEGAGRVIRCWYQISSNDWSIPAETEEWMAERISAGGARSKRRARKLIGVFERIDFLIAVLCAIVGAAARPARERCLAPLIVAAAR